MNRKSVDIHLAAWPARMKAPLAAFFMGVSESKFHNEVKEGRYPKPVKDGGSTLWHLEDLIAASERIKHEYLGTEVDHGEDEDAPSTSDWTERLRNVREAETR